MSTLHCHFQIQIQIQSDICSALQIASSTFRCLRSRTFNLPRRLLLPPLHSHSTTSFVSLPRAFSNDASVPDKPSICTADELHYVSLPNSDWRLALWRYHPPPQAPRRNHPLLLLSGVGTNAIGYDLSPGSSFARYMSGQGFDTWILEVRGAGLSVQASNFKEFKETADAVSEQMETMVKSVIKGVSSQQQPTNVSGSLSDSEISFLREDSIGIGTAWDESKVVTKLTEIFMRLSERLSGFLSDSQLRLISAKLFDQISKLLEDSQLSERFEEMEYVMAQTKPKDGKLLAIGHSMGGILLYAMLSRCGFEGREPRLKAVVTLASSLDYTSSDSTLKLLLPLADPAQALNVPVVPLGTLLAAAYPLSSQPPYVLAWLNNLISAEDMMHPELLKKLVLNNFCTIPAKLILQLATAFRAQGLCDRSGKYFYKDHLHKSNVPVLAIAGDQDIICPPEAVEETVKLFPENLVMFRVFGEQQGPHYAHYDLVGGRLAVEQVYPCIVQFLSQYD
ncbi:uncharacterized protein LOC111282026 isoform X3 [Durio zibethinus]|uniref:Uncharacterized protein LOC111282026 isoform X3 n=1 Tax=Durio zibethinus TaxID=66656 RepID=A0A6P5XBH1_DURZI|nr:uncharacterized protein LOC111282026 isoform X3 [Durio zibethinus]